METEGSLRTRQVVVQENRTATEEGNRGQHKVNIQKRDLTLVHILTSIESTCKALVRTVHCLAEARHLLKSTFQGVSEASIDAKLWKLPTVKLERGEKILAYSNWIVELASEVDTAGLEISRGEMKRALLRELTNKIDITSDSIMINGLI